MLKNKTSKTSGDVLLENISSAPTHKYKLETFAIMPTWQCDAACHHCVFNSSPKITKKIDQKTVIDAIFGLKKISTIKRVTVSGGEAFLDIDYLRSLAIATNQNNLAFRVVTNGSFATTLDIAQKTIERISNIGLETIGVSWDEFHSKFISAECIRNLIKAARRLGVSVKLTAVVTKSHTLSAALQQLGDEGFELPSVQVKCLPVGRAEKKVHLTDLLPPATSDTNRSCKSDFDTLSLTPDGSIYPCCAVGGFTDGIKLGTIPSESLETLLYRRDNDLTWAILSSQGPSYFLKSMTPAERAYVGIPEAPTHDCVICNKIFRTPAGIKVVRHVIDRVNAQALEIINASLKP